MGMFFSTASLRFGPRPFFLAAGCLAATLVHAELPAFADIVGGSLSVSDTSVRATLTVADLPASLPINQSWVQPGYNEYLWGVHLDMDGNDAFTDGDMIFWVWHPTVSGAAQTTAPVASFSKHLRAMVGASANEAADISPYVSISGNTITYDVPRSVYSGLANVTSATRYRFYTYYNSSTGGVNDYFSGGSVTMADTTPDAFSFAPVTDSAPGAAVTSNAIAVGGIDTTAAIAISGGEYSINNGAWTAASGTVALGNQVKVRLTAPTGYGETGSATLTIGDVSASFAVTTRSYTPVTAVTEVFSNAGTAASVVAGVVRIAAAPTAPLQLAAGAVQNAVVALDTDAAVPVLSGSATLNYTRGGSDTALQIRTVAGSPALTPISGSVDIAAPAAGSSIPVTGDSGGSARLVTSAADTQVTAGRDASRNLVVAVSAGPVTYTSTATRSSRSTRALPTSFTVYPGEAVLADDSGSAGQVRLGSFAQDGSQAGDYLANLPNAASTLNVPRVAGSSQRFGADWTTLVGQAIASKLGLGTATSLTQDAASGVMTLVTSTGTYRFLPVGTLALADAALGDTSRAVSVADIAANLTAILDSSLSFAVAPATAYADLQTALRSISSAATLEVLGDGVLKASLSGTDYIAQPASQATAGCPGFVTENNQLALCDAAGKRQVLNAAFADTDTLRSTFRTSLSLPTLSVTNTGANGAYAALVGGTPYTLSPDITLSTPPSSQAGNLWWQDAASGKIYIRYPDGSAQGFGLQ